jgi:hypothetical protein
MRIKKFYNDWFRHSEGGIHRDTNSMEIVYAYFFFFFKIRNAGYKTDFNAVKTQSSVYFVPSPQNRLFF